MKIKSGGEAKDRQFVRRDPKRSDASAQDEVLRQNRDAFTRMAKLNPEEHDSRMLAKVTGGLDHGGKNVLKSDSTGYRILAEFVRRMNSTTSASCECSRRNKSNAKSPPKSWNLAATASTRGHQTQDEPLVEKRDKPRNSPQPTRTFPTSIVMLD